VAGGCGIGCSVQHQYLIHFLSDNEREVTAGKLIEVILDDYAARKHFKVIEWFGRHPRFKFHFTPTSASLVNSREDFFTKLTKRQFKRGMFQGIVSLQEVINQFVAQLGQAASLQLDQRSRRSSRGSSRAPLLGR
jgi:hypothetical protein